MSPIEKDIMIRKLGVMVDNLNYDLILKAICTAEDLYPRYVKAVNDYLDRRF